MRTYLPWSADLSVGLDEIDAQHRVLVDLINRIYDAMVRQAPRAQVGEILDELVQYTAVHFSVEESLFRITDYPDYEGHRQLHDRLRRQVMDIQARFQAGLIEADFSLLQFLKHWLEHHIQGEDRHYVAHFLRSGLKKSWARTSWMGKVWNSLAA